MSKLFVVPTPIGNLEDITFRALRVLKEVSFILAEDTRTSSVLLKHYEIGNKMFAFHQHNEHRVLNDFVTRIESGETAALITDAGTPGISDPGFLIIRECLLHGIEVECLPGPVAFIPALVVSGLPCDRFFFEGFLPVKKGRSTRLKEIERLPGTIVFYESPHRILKTLGDLQTACGDRQVSVSREISKKFEETLRGKISEVIAALNKGTIKGEFVVVLEGAGWKPKDASAEIQAD